MGLIARYASREATNGAAGSRGEMHARQLQVSSSAAERRGQSDSEECERGPALKARLPPPPLPLQARAQAGQPKLSNPPLPVRDPWQRRRSTSRCAYGTRSRGACGVERARSVTGAPRPRFLAALGDKRAKAPVSGDLESRRDQSLKRKQPRATKTGHELSKAT